jgi:hypothetical protein
LTAFVAASGALHASLAMVDERPPARALLGPQREPVHVELTIEEGLTLTPDEPREPPAPPRPRPRVSTPRPPVVTPPPAPAVSETPPAPAPRHAPSVEPAPPRVVDISPLAAARGLVDVRVQPAAAPRAATRAPTTAGIPLTEYLAASTKASDITSRADDPVLTPQRGGGYTFEGTGFDATIARDGSVRFDDAYGSFSLLPFRHDGSPNLWFFNAAFDLTAFMEHVMGNDPYRSERRWFIERTAELRERMANEAFERLSAQARIKLRHALQDVWNDPALTLAQKKQETFEHWDMNADDEVGALGREQVREFVRERCPLGSACAFTAHELSALNRGRKSRALFAPYDDEQAGARER